MKTVRPTKNKNSKSKQLPSPPTIQIDVWMLVEAERTCDGSDVHNVKALIASYLGFWEEVEERKKLKMAVGSLLEHIEKVDRKLRNIVLQSKYRKAAQALASLPEPELLGSI